MVTYEQFVREVAKTDHVPVDLELLVRSTIDGAPSPFDDLGVVAVLPGEDVNDTSYLSESELADPDIAENIAAIGHVLERAVMVAKSEDGVHFGYWVDGRDGDLEGAPIVSFDSEGQFALEPGASLAEAIAWQVTFGDPDEWGELRDGFAEHGIAFSVDDPDELGDEPVAAPSDPRALHLAFVNDSRVARGLDPIG
ncbi:hypothetical protein F8O01_13070 [Pseudoclavibacter chungangensis]|uniref:Uncharacterized protein n=1 Tax=Pseudoclavibacter chungangensis TaxID=587635 RepID=A0A7J5BPK2_9MICO|nr:hypothetical protein [Pseudoclavibacter chungangensis]KAB1654821.1 hypothetical protein F8O01_13070 [Pseudoclavibacter chungangensis]NYJ68056.1 hypothetical protein [Pseudoclavibacter chungangensis]